MTLTNLIERLREIKKPLTPEQANFLESTFGHKADYSLIPSDAFRIEASLKKEHGFILHPNGFADQSFNANETNSFGFAHWAYPSDEKLVFIAYF